MGEVVNAYSILVGKPEGNIPLVKSTRRCEDNIRMDLMEIKWRLWTGFVWLKIGTSGALL
jgi:hypothetical protein